jgi:hypothetical protein
MFAVMQRYAINPILSCFLSHFLMKVKQSTPYNEKNVLYACIIVKPLNKLQWREKNQFKANPDQYCRIEMNFSYLMIKS